MAFQIGRPSTNRDNGRNDRNTLNDAGDLNGNRGISIAGSSYLVLRQKGKNRKRNAYLLGKEKSRLRHCCCRRRLPSSRLYVSGKRREERKGRQQRSPAATTSLEAEARGRSSHASKEWSSVASKRRRRRRVVGRFGGFKSAPRFNGVNRRAPAI